MNKKDATILLVDDDTSALTSLGDVLKKDGYNIRSASDGDEALIEIKKNVPDLVFTDLRMRQMDGMQLLGHIKTAYPEIPVVVMTAFTSMETAVEAIKNGAYDYLSKPFKLDQLRLVVERTLNQAGLIKENKRLKKLVDDKEQQPVIVGRSAEMVEIYKMVGKVSGLMTTVLIQGESGTGKDVIARLIHQNSNRDGSFLAVNCGALAEGVLESELFGHVKGSFTGAQFERIGLFEAAQNGTCFLDEIGNTSLGLQSKLLRVLEEGEVLPVGSTKPLKINCRIVAATNTPLEKLVKKGLFREDLFYRLNVVTITMPPLRERLSDIPLLLDFFVEKYSGLQGKSISVHEEVQAMLQSYKWPGNVRELAHAVERAVALNSSSMLTSDDFPEALVEQAHNESHTNTYLQSISGFPTLDDVAVNYVKHVIQKMNSNMTKAAEVLDIDRRTLYRMLEREKSKNKQND